MQFLQTVKIHTHTLRKAFIRHNPALNNSNDNQYEINIISFLRVLRFIQLLFLSILDSSKPWNIGNARIHASQIDLFNLFFSSWLDWPWTSSTIAHLRFVYTNVKIGR